MTSPSSTLADALPQPAQEEPTVVIEPSTGLFPSLRLRELWLYRELFYFLIWRDIKVRYKQSVLGVLWIVIQPLVTMVVFTLLFNRLLGVDSDGEVPYPVFTYAALLPWTYFSGVVGRGALSLVNDRNLISKVYFPRLIVPIANVLGGLIDFAIGFLILLVLMVVYNVLPGARMLYLVFPLLLAVITAIGFVLWLSALTVKYRDFKYLTPFLMQTMMYASPIIYPVSRIPEQWRWLYDLNPMVGVIQSFRWVLAGESFSGVSGVSIFLSILLLVSGTIYFRQTEKVFADVV